MAARGNFGSFYGTAAAGVDIVQTIKNQVDFEKRKWRVSTQFKLLKVAITGQPGTLFKLNGQTVVLPSTGIFETGIGIIDIESIVFSESSEVNILYMY